jgi:hypothetical protein
MLEVTLIDELPMCAICGQPVGLEAANTDEDGQAVHEGCYSSKLMRHPDAVSQRRCG